MHKSKHAEQKLWFYTIFTFLILLYFTNLFSSSPKEKINKYIKPPKLRDGNFSETLDLLLLHISLNEVQLGEEKLSKIVQRQIQNIQEKDCQAPNFQCGHNGVICGFGCQIHHRVACLMISYATGMPLIHTVDEDRWTNSFSKRWSDVFQPLGSNCTPDRNTYSWTWYGRPPYFSKTFTYPLMHGLPVDAELVTLIEKISPDPFQWLIGQFTKHAMRLNASFEQNLESWKTGVGFDKDSPIAGIHVRLTDKIKESKTSLHLLQLYLDEVEEYFRVTEISQDLAPSTLKRRVFVASDNTSIFEEAAQLQPDWEILGFPANFSESIDLRKNGLIEIVRDTELLAQCDYVICGLTSNVCRLILEMQSYLNFDGPHILPVDGVYDFILVEPYSLSSENNNKKILKIES